MSKGGRESRGEERRVVKRETGRQRLREKHAGLPRHYRGYEALLVDDSCPVPPIPTGERTTKNSHYKKIVLICIYTTNSGFLTLLNVELLLRKPLVSVSDDVG